MQYLVFTSLVAGLETKGLRMLHFAPETFFMDAFAKLFGTYETADISMSNVDHKVNMCFLPFPAASYDIVYASHVLEHIRDDHLAIAELRRILAPNGIAILPVPIMGPTTIEYSEPNKYESMHVRAPGLDYFARFEPYFKEIDLYSSADFSEQYQPFIYESRADSTNKVSRRRGAMGEYNRYDDVVPVCHVR